MSAAGRITATKDPATALTARGHGPTSEESNLFSVSRRDLAFIDRSDLRYNHFLRLAIAFRTRQGPLGLDSLTSLWEAAERARLLDERLAAEHGRRNFGVGPNVVYYVQLDRVVKIGTTCNLMARMTALALRTVIGLEPGSLHEESARHRQFKHLRVQGEWFLLTPELKAHIAGLPDDWKLVREDLTLVSVDVASKMVGVHKSTIYRWGDSGKICRYGPLVNQKEVEAYAASLRVSA